MLVKQPFYHDLEGGGTENVGIKFCRNVADVNMDKSICRPQTPFFPIIKVSQQFLKKGISSIKPLIQRIYKISTTSFELIKKESTLKDYLIKKGIVIYNSLLY